MRLVVITASLLALCACYPQPNPSICRALPSDQKVNDIASKMDRLAGAVDAEGKKTYIDAVTWLASTCVRKAAYKFALDDKSNNQAVKDAVVADCSYKIDQYARVKAWSRMEDMSQSDPANSASYLDQFRQEASASLSDLALASVAEARAGHCRPVQ